MADPTYVPFGNEPVFVADEPIADMTPSFSAYFEAAAGNVIRDSPLSSIYRMGELAAANSQGGVRAQSRVDARRLAPDVARAKAEAAGVTVDFGDTRYTPEAVDIMIDRAKRRAVRDTVINAYDPSIGTQLGVSLVTSLADPLNVASAFIPFVGQARYTAWLAGTTTLGGRSAVRAGVGAIEGLAGSALVEPFIAGAATQEGRDYGLADSLYNLAFGTAFGAGLHAGGGAIKDKLFKRRMANAPIETPADIVERLPVEVNEAALRGAVSDLIHGRPVQSSELIDSLLQTNPALKDALSVTSTLRRDGPDLDDVAARVSYWEEKLNALKAKEPKVADFMTWLRQQGGVRDDDGALATALGGDASHLPSSVYISPKGAKRAKRGLTLDDLLTRAKAEGYASSLDDLTAALQPGAKVLTQTAQQAIEARAALAAHAEKMQAESGVSKNRPIAVKARAIAGREQHLLANERARIAHAIDVLMGRKQDYEQIAEGPKDVEVPEYVPEPSPAPVAEVGPDGKPKAEETGAFGKPLTSEEKLTKGEDPTPRDAEGKAIPGSRTYTVRQVQKAIETSIKVNDGNAVPSQRVIDDYLPGISRGKFDAAVKEVQKRKPALVKRNGKDGTEVVMFGKLSKEKQEESTVKMMAHKVDSVRRLMAQQYPGLPNGPFFLNEIFGARNRANFEIGEEGIVKHINRAILDGKIEATAQATTSTNPPRRIGRIAPDHLYSDDRSVDVMITFKDPPPAPLKDKPTAALPPETNVELPPAPVVKVDTPPAPLHALKVAEIEAAEAQFKAVEAETVKRFQAVASMLPAETTVRLKAMLEKINAEATDLENVYNTAVTCLLNPES